MSRPKANNAPPTPPDTPPLQQEDSTQDTVGKTLSRTVGKGSLQSGLGGGLGFIALGPVGGLVGGLVGVVYGSVLAGTEGIRDKYQPGGWAGDGVPPTYVNSVSGRQGSQKKYGIQNRGFPHGSPSQRKNPRAENVRQGGQKRTSSSPGPQPDRVSTIPRPTATPRSRLNPGSSAPSKRITSLTPLPPVPKMIDLNAPNSLNAPSPPKTSPSFSPSSGRKITSMSPIPKLNAPPSPPSPPKASPTAQRKTLPSNPRPQTIKQSQPKPPSLQATSASPDPAFNPTRDSSTVQADPPSASNDNQDISLSEFRPSLLPAPLKPAARRSTGRRRRKGGANGSESSESQAGDSGYNKNLSIIDAYLG